MDAFAIARLAAGTGFLGAAAVMDVRTRRVPDPVWVALGTLGLATLVAGLALESASLDLYALVAATAIVFYTIFYGAPLFEEDGFHLRPARLGLFLVAAILVGITEPLAVGEGGAHASEYVRLLTMPAMVLVYQAFYQVGLLRGGADAKAMIALTVLFPLYPDASPFPLLAAAPAVMQAMQVFFPYSLTVLVDAAVLFLVVPLAYLVVNAARGDLEFPQAFFGTKAFLDRLPHHVWLMERVDGHGRRVVVLFPSRAKDESKEIAKLRAMGMKRVWVQPKVPFLVPLLLGFLLAFFVGNVLLGFVAAVFPRP